MSTIGLIHSTRLVIEAVHTTISKANPELEIINLLDEGLLRCLKKQENDQIHSRMVGLAERLQEDGADLIIVSCSSLSPFVNGMRRTIKTPLVKIDEPMIEWAVKNYHKIGVVMTNPTTQEPTRSLIQEVAQRLNKAISVEYKLCAEAFNRLNQGDPQGHDAAVVNAVETLMEKVDVVILAQISIARVINQVDSKIRDRVLSSLNFINTKLPL